MSETYHPNPIDDTKPRQQDFSRIPSDVISWEMLNAMDDQAFIEVYRLLVRLKQRDAAALLAEYARRIAEIDVAEAPVRTFQRKLISLIEKLLQP